MESSGGEVRYEDNANYCAKDTVSVDTLGWTAPPAEYIVTQHHDPDPNQLSGQFQPPQAQPPNQNYLMYPQSQQFTLLNSSNSVGPSGATSWFTSEPILCSLMPGVNQSSEANVCVAFTMEDINFGEAALDSNHLFHPMYNGDQSGQVVLMNSEPEPVFVTLENAPVHRNNIFCQDEGVTLPFDCPADQLLYSGQNTNNNAGDFPILYNQGAFSLDSREPPVARSRHTSISQTPFAPRSRKSCHCAKSMCLKLYCECFAGGVMCNNCPCKNCHNNTEHEAKREKAIKTCLVRNPDAFGPKISDGKSGKGRHSKGCNCKRSGCLKNYCECYELQEQKEETRRKSQDTLEGLCRLAWERLRSLPDEREEDRGGGGRPPSVITPVMVEGVVVSLLARAEEAEREQRCEAWAQHMILNEFGRCITEIAFERNKQKLKTAVMWILTVVISLFMEVRTAHKMKIHWGPQSMMYLKGKHGRRFVSEQDGRIMSLQDWNTLLKGVQPVEFSKPRQFVSSEKVLIQYLLER